MDLGADFHQPVTIAEVVGDLAGIVLAGKCIEESGFPFEDVARTPDTFACKQRGHYARLGAERTI